MQDDLDYIAGISYSEGEYHFARGTYLDEKKLVQQIIDSASIRPKPQEPAVLILMSNEEYEAYQKLRFLLKKRGFSDK